MKQFKIKLRETRKPKYQFRFWSTRDRHEAFTKVCDDLDLYYQDVMNQLIDWFIETQKSKKRKDHRV